MVWTHLDAPTRFASRLPQPLPSYVKLQKSSDAKGKEQDGSIQNSPDARCTCGSKGKTPSKFRRMIQKRLTRRSGSDNSESPSLFSTRSLSATTARLFLGRRIKSRDVQQNKAPDPPKKSPKISKPVKLVCLSPSAERLLDDDDETKGDLGTCITDINGEMLTAVDGAIQREQDPRLTWSLKILDQGALQILKRFKSVRRYRPAHVTVSAFRANPEKNRYEDVQCMDATRVILRDHPCDYIHANFLTTSKGVKFICTQAPLEETISDFWHMILQEDCRTIVMLCRLEEDNRKQCARYFPEEAGSPFIVDDISITVMEQSWSEDCSLMTSVWKVKRGELEFVLRHIQCKNWPDHSAPIDATGTIQLHREIVQCPRGHPIVIHCSAGIGRTCTLLGIELMLEHVRLLNSQSGTKVVRTMRHFRLGAVQKAIQFLFMHIVLLELFCQDEVFSSSDSRMLSFRETYEHLLMKADRMKAERKKGKRKKKHDRKTKTKHKSRRIEVDAEPRHRTSREMQEY